MTDNINPSNMIIDTEGLVDIIVILILMVILIYAMIKTYKNLRIPIVICTVYIFSLIVGIIAINKGNLPYTPLVEILFMVLQSSFFISTCVELFRK